MSNSWFRLYAEFAHDPKVQMMPEHMQRRYVMLMCMRCSDVTVTLRDDEIAFQLRISETELAETKRLFVSKGFVDSDWNLCNWDKRQFSSDHDPSGAERQKRYREKQKERKAVTLRNAPVTLPDTDTDTDKKNTSLSVPDCPHEQIIDAYSEKLAELAQPIRSLWRDGKNAPALKSRWQWVMTAVHESGKRKGERLATTEQEGIEWFSRFFAYVSSSDHLMGRNGEWACNLIWLVNKSNFEKVIQGSYENQKAAA